MQDLINHLSNPYTNNDGKIIEPNIYMRRAATVIKELLPRAQADLQGRLRAEQKEQEILEELIRIRDNQELTEQAVAEYRNAFNKEFENDYG